MAGGHGVDDRSKRPGVEGAGGVRHRNFRIGPTAVRAAFDRFPAADEDALWRILTRAAEEADRHQHHRLTPESPAPAP